MNLSKCIQINKKYITIKKLKTFKKLLDKKKSKMKIDITYFLIPQNFFLRILTKLEEKYQEISSLKT